MKMFSQESLVLKIDVAYLDSTDPSLVTGLLQHISKDPRDARSKRSSVVLSFEKAGVGKLYRDERATRWVAELFRQAPWVGYYLHGDPPTYLLREFYVALACSRVSPVTVQACVEAHQEVLNNACAYCDKVGDAPASLEEVFISNFVHEVFEQRPDLRLRAMKALHPILLIALSASGSFQRRAFREAERIWGRAEAEFASKNDFLRAFEAHLKQ
jgi:hypothetical protein